MIPRWQKILATVVGGYEITAVWADRPGLPTISQICKRRPWLTGLIVGGLAAHFHPHREGR